MQFLLHLVVVANKAQVDSIRPVTEQKTQAQPSPALKGMWTHLTNPQTTVNMRPLKCLRQFAHRIPTSLLLRQGKGGELLEEFRFDDERLIQGPTAS